MKFLLTDLIPAKGAKHFFKAEHKVETPYAKQTRAEAFASTRSMLGCGPFKTVFGSGQAQGHDERSSNDLSNRNLIVHCLYSLNVSHRSFDLRLQAFGFHRSRERYLAIHYAGDNAKR